MASGATETHAERRYEIYLAHRQALIQIETDQIRSFDRTILSVASGGLALSIAFSEKIASANPEHSWLLYVSWFIFCVCILVTTSSFLLAAHASARQREIFDKFFETEAEGPEPANPFGAWVARLNVLSLVLIFTATLLLTWFAVVNFEKRTQAGKAQIIAAQANIGAPSNPQECAGVAQSDSAAQAGRRPAATIGSTTTKRPETPKKD